MSCQYDLFTKRRQNRFKIGTRDKFISGRKICFTLFQMISYLHDFFNERWFSHKILCMHKKLSHTPQYPPRILSLGSLWEKLVLRIQNGGLTTQHDTDKRRESFLIWPIFDRNCTFKWVIVSIFHLILCFFHDSRRSESIWVDQSWSDPDCRSELIRSTFVAWQVVIAFHNHNNFVGGWNCNKASDIWKFHQIGRVVLKADFEKTRVENTVAHRVHRFNKEITTQRKKIPCKHKIHIEKNISSTLQTKLKLYKKYAHGKQKNHILQTKLPHTLQTKTKL